MATKIDVLVVGGGQAGIAMSEHLGNLGISHIVLERARIAERWRSERWDSLVANGPAWHDCFPTMEISSVAQNAFPTKEEIADYFVAYAKMINAPIQSGVEVTSVVKQKQKPGFLVETTAGTFQANQVVAATGPFQVPVYPQIIPHTAPVHQLHSNSYKNPQQMPDGGVLVVGAGSSGVQIAEELLEAGRTVYLSVGPHDRLPRRYRGRDFVWWLGVLGLWDVPALEPGKEHVTIAVSGANGGKTVDFRALAAKGMQLVGRTGSYSAGSINFDGDLVRNIAEGDAYYHSVLNRADAYVERNGLDLPSDPAARARLADPECLTNPIRALNLAKAGITTVLWATGYRQNFDWLKVDAFDAAGKPAHQRGVSTEQGVYFLGLPWLSRRGSSFIWGVWHDAKYIADHIAIQQSYARHTGADMDMPARKEA